MRLFLIRHAETVDNVAQVYAGLRDSALTTHGSLQAERLGRFFTNQGLSFSKVYSSDLQRALKTATAICSWNKAAQDIDLDVTPLMVLREQDFGSYEGKPFLVRSRDPNVSAKGDHRSRHRDDPGFIDVESKESMVSRMNHFLQDHLIPLLQSEKRDVEENVAIVSHGIILSHLWRCLLKLMSHNSVSLRLGGSVGNEGSTSLEHLGNWSNTGYLELQIQGKPLAGKNKVAKDACSSTVAKYDHLPSLSGYKIIVKTVNGREHLQGLKRTRGGVGSSKFDEGQKSIDSFFKKQRLG